MKIKKQFGASLLMIEAGAVEPNIKTRTPNLIEMVMEEKGLKLRLRFVKVELKEGERSLSFTAEAALSNEEFTRMKITGVRDLKQKGFGIRPEHSLNMLVKGDKVYFYSGN
ncbi:MAG: hypothetical protein Q8J64_06175 [Thermodesulfovibrionales bacterium]|nr:hypothetical protein [Thermodesulfovibrionales bacterium]